MKVTIAPDGTVELDVAPGDGQAALDLIRAMQGQQQPGPAAGPPVARLTVTQFATYSVLREFPEGAYYADIAALLGMADEESIVATRCNVLTKTEPPVAERVGRGVYRPLPGVKVVPR
jgi:hypothetical protein